LWTRLVGINCILGSPAPSSNLYDIVHAAGIREALPMLEQDGERFDAVVLGDAIRHFEKPDGEALLPQLDHLLTSRGALFMILRDQGAARPEGPPPRSDWTVDDLRRLNFEILLDGNRDKFGCKMLAAFRGRAPASR